MKQECTLRASSPFVHSRMGERKTLGHNGCDEFISLQLHLPNAHFFGRIFASLLLYSQLSANGHSRKRTALLTNAFSDASQSNSVFAHSHKPTLSRKRTRTLLKMKIGVSFCLRSLIRGHPMYNNCRLAMKFVFLKFAINQHKYFAELTE